jgi:DNA-binding transcriptional MerR regulator
MTEPQREYRVDDLARAAGTTVRNVRAYQDRGLLPPPRKQGRVGIYDDGHLARLRVISELLDRGYTLANIGEILQAWGRGQNVAELVGLEAAIAAPWSDEEPDHVTPEQLVDLFGAPEGEDLDLAIELGYLEVEGDRFRVPSPRLLEAAAELAAAGIPVAAILEHGRRLREDIDRVAEQFVGLATEYLFEPLGDTIPADEIPRLAAVVERLRPVAQTVVDAELAKAMDRHTTQQAGERLQRVLNQQEPESA